MRRKSIFFLFVFLCIGFASAQQQYDTRLKEGIRLYEKNRFDDAIDRFRSAGKAADIPVGAINTVYEWIDRCKKAQAEIRQRFDVSPQSISVSSFGEYTEISIKAGMQWQVKKIPQWCRIESQSSSHLRIFCQENDTTTPRTDSVILSMGKKQKVVLLIQKAAEPKTGRVVFRTNPNHAKIDFWDGSPQKLSAESYEIKEGKYNVRISKYGYQPFDTIIHILPKDALRTRYIDVHLKPLFAEVKLDIQAQEGSLFEASPTLYIGNRKIDLEPMFTNSVARSYDDEKNLEYFNLYKGNVIPLVPGNYILTLKTPGFEDYTEHIEVKAGESKNFSAILQLTSGFLSISGNTDADNALIYVDDRKVGSVPAYKIKVGVGKHSLRFEKDGFKTEQEEYETEIEENNETRLHITMRKYVHCQVNSVPELAEIVVDGKSVGFTPMRIALTEGTHKIDIQKEGFLTYTKNITIEPEAGNHDINATLESSHPLKIVSDEPGYEIVIKRKKQVIQSGMKTPAEVLLPYGKYTLLLKRDNGKKAYKGPFRHTSKKKTLNILTYARYNFSILGADYFINPQHYNTLMEDGQQVHMFRRLGDAYFGKVKILPGLSTTIAKTSFFLLEKDFSEMVLPETEDLKAQNMPHYMMSASCILLNADIRIGGAILKNLDINVLGSYTWYPDYSKIVSLSHVHGHDIFAGIELTTRFQVFNLNLKMGAQIFSGEYLIQREKKSSSNTQNLITAFPAQYAGFVISAGISLGTKDNRGNNLLRVW